MKTLLRDIRIVPVVLIAICCLVVLKVAGLLLDLLGPAYVEVTLAETCQRGGQDVGQGDGQTDQAGEFAGGDG